MKEFLLIFAIVFIVQIGYAQIDSLYLGQIPPGTTPVLFADDLITGGTAYQCARIAISADGKEIYFTRRNNLSIREENIQYFKYENNTWGGPFVLFPDLKSVHLAPTFSPDFDTLYFQVYDYDLNLTTSYFSIKDTVGWTTPQLFRGYTGELYYLEETNNHNFYVGVQQAIDLIGKWDICKITFNNDTISTIQSIGIPINTTNNDVEFFIAKDESFIVLGRNENFTIRNRDLYISYKKGDGTWSNPKSLGPKINDGSTLKWGPFVTPDNKYLFYESTKIRWNTWWVRFDGLLDSLRYTNFPPYVKNIIPDQTAIQDSMFSYQIPDSIYFDDDGNHTLTYTAIIKSNSRPPFTPTWCSFDSLSRTIYGIPGDEAANYTVTVTATDTAGANVSAEFRLNIDMPRGIENINNQLPVEFKLNQNYPNPFNPDTQIKYQLRKRTHVRLNIYNLSGQKINTLVHNWQEAGNHKVHWNATDDNYKQVSSGIYICQLECDGYVLAKKMLYLK